MLNLDNNLIRGIRQVKGKNLALRFELHQSILAIKRRTEKSLTS